MDDKYEVKYAYYYSGTKQMRIGDAIQEFDTLEDAVAFAKSPSATEVCDPVIYYKGKLVSYH